MKLLVALGLGCVLVVAAGLWLLANWRHLKAAYQDRNRIALTDERLFELRCRRD